MFLFVKIALTGVAVFAFAQILARIVCKRAPSPAPAFISIFLASPIRRRMQPPRQVISRSCIGEGMRVLEVGCGNGAFTTAAARAVGRSGRIVAFDIQLAMLKRLIARLSGATNSDIGNVEPVLGDAVTLPFVDASFDRVFMVAALPEVPDTHAALLEAKRVLGPRGVLALTELLPDPDYPLRSTTIRRGERAGFRLKSVSGNFFDYTVCFEKI